MKIIVTLGPATNTEADVRKIKARGVDFVRTNMSHSSVADMERFIALAKKVDIPFIVDTEGSQRRTGDLKENTIFLEENRRIDLCAEEFKGDEHRITLRPKEILSQLEAGDILYLDFDSAVLRVADTEQATSGFVRADVLVSGAVEIGRASCRE